MDDGNASTLAWNRPDVRDALARGDWPIVLRAFLDSGLSQTAIAARTGLSQSQISRLASGQSRTPGMKTVKALCDGLTVPRQLAGLLDDTMQEDDTDRRQFLGGSLGLLAAAAFPRSDLGDEQLLMTTSLSYRQLEQHASPDTCPASHRPSVAGLCSHGPGGREASRPPSSGCLRGRRARRLAPCRPDRASTSTALLQDVHSRRPKGAASAAGDLHAGQLRPVRHDGGRCGPRAAPPARCHRTAAPVRAAHSTRMAGLSGGGQPRLPRRPRRPESSR